MLCNVPLNPDHTARGPSGRAPKGLESFSPPWAKISHRDLLLKCPNCLVRRPYLKSLAIDIEVKILLRDCLVRSVLQQIGERIVQSIFQISISFAEADCR